MHNVINSFVIVVGNSDNNDGDSANDGGVEVKIFVFNLVHL